MLLNVVLNYINAVKIGLEMSGFEIGINSGTQIHVQIDDKFRTAAV